MTADLRRLPVHQRPGDRVAVRGHREEHRGQPVQVGLAEVALVHGDGHVAYRGQAEVVGRRGAERRSPGPGRPSRAWRATSPPGPAPGHRPSPRSACRAPGSARPSPVGATATQLMPAPQVTATPQGSSSPPRSIANVSFIATAVCDQPPASSAAVSAASSSGRSAPARHAETCAGDDAGAVDAGLARATVRTSSPSRRMAPSMPCPRATRPDRAGRRAPSRPSR